MVVPLAVGSQGDSANEETRRNEENEGTTNGQKLHIKPVLVRSILLIALHALDALLLVILLPFIIWQWISASDRLKLVLKAVVEVTLELIMWMIFAGVSVLMTTTFVLEDTYFQKSDHENLTQSLSTQNGSTSGINNSKRILQTRGLPKEKDKSMTL